MQSLAALGCQDRGLMMLCVHVCMHRRGRAEPGRGAWGMQGFARHRHHARPAALGMLSLAQLAPAWPRAPRLVQYHHPSAAGGGGWAFQPDLTFSSLVPLPLACCHYPAAGAALAGAGACGVAGCSRLGRGERGSSSSSRGASGRRGHSSNCCCCPTGHRARQPCSGRWQRHAAAWRRRLWGRQPQRQGAA